MPAPDVTPSPTLTAAASPVKTRQRYVLVAMLFLHTINTYLDRVCISAAKGDIAAHLRLSDQTMGYVFAVFALGYALFQIPAGWMADTYGPRRTLTGIVALWSGFTALTGAAWNAASLLVVRLLFGVGEAGAFPGATGAIYRWLPVQDRSVAQGIFHSGARLGGAFSLFTIPLLIEAVGWRLAFVVCGALGVVWAVAWWVWFRDRPADHPGVNAAELTYIEASPPTSLAEPTGQFPLGQVLTSANVLLLFFQAAAGSFTMFVAYSWLLPYLADTWGRQASGYAALPPLLGAVALWLSGPFIRWLYRRGWGVFSRKAPAMVGKGLAALSLLVATQVQSPLGFVLLFGLAIFGIEFCTNSSWTTSMDIGAGRSGAVSATMNMGSNIGSAASAILFPFFVQHVRLPHFAETTGTANAYFVFAAGLNLLALGAWVLIDPRRKLAEGVSPARIRWRVAIFSTLAVVAAAALILLPLFSS